MTVLDGGKVKISGNVRIDVQKAWNFDKTDSVHGFPLGVFTEMNTIGIARDYVVQGSKTVSYEQVLTP